VNPNLPGGGADFNIEMGMKAAFPEGLTQFGLTMSYANIQGETLTGQDIRIDPVFSTLSLRHHFGDGFSTNLSLPIGTVGISSGDQDHFVSGLGDISLGFRQDLASFWGLGAYRPRLALSLNIGLPSGTEASVGQLGTYFPPNLISIGYNAFSLEGRLEFTQPVYRGIALKINAATRAPLTPSSSGLAYGRTLNYGLGGVYMPIENLGFILQIQGRSLTELKERGTTVITNSGGTVLSAGGGLFYRVSDSLGMGLQAVAPIHLALNGTQPSQVFSVLASAVLTFDKKGKHTHDWNDEDHGHVHVDGHIHGAQQEHNHDHGTDHQQDTDNHEDEHQHHKKSESKAKSGDVSDLAVEGESFTLSNALVARKITVIDFWADWCKPCIVLSKQLEQLASKNESLAIRRVEVPTFDSPVAKEHIPNAKGLPILWIYDRQGKLLNTLEAVSPKDAIIEIEKALKSSGSPENPLRAKANEEGLF
jgi:thiol-disulfide isomerase/thioredoxin